MKKKLLYRAVEWVTLVLPLSVYLLVMAFVFNIKADVYVNGELAQVEVVRHFENNYIVALDDEVTFRGQVEKVGDTYGLYINDTMIVKFKDGYFTYSDEWQNVKDKEIKAQASAKIPFSTAVSIFAIVIVGLVVFNKMQFQKKYPRVATFLALFFGTLILLGIHLIIGEILYVFVIATISWLAYMIEHAIFENNLTQEQGKKATSELTNVLSNVLDGLKK